MSDQDTPPPMDDPSSNPESGTPPETTPPTGGPASPPPPSGNVALGLGKLQESEEKTMGLLAHLLGGVTCILGPLIIWLIKKEESPFVDDQGKEALNFQITVMFGYIICLVISAIPIISCFSYLLYMAVWVTSLVFAILGGMQANQGVVHRYPFAIRLVK